MSSPQERFEGLKPALKALAKQMGQRIDLDSVILPLTISLATEHNHPSSLTSHTLEGPRIDEPSPPTDAATLLTGTAKARLSLPTGQGR